MDAAESNRIYQQADQLFKAGRFEDALSLLDQLNRAFPGTREILYPTALCLERLGRNRDGIQLCNQLIAKYQDGNALALRERLERAAGQSAPGMSRADNTSLASLGLAGASDILDFEPIRRAPVHIVGKEDSEWKRYLLIGVGVVALLALVLVPPFFYKTPSAIPAGNGQSITHEDFVHGISIGVYALLILISGIGYAAGGYVALALMSKLPSDEFISNCVSLGTTVLIMFALNFIPIVGPIAALVIVSKMYDLGCGGLMIFCFIAALGSVVIGIVPIMMLIASMGNAVPVQ